MLSKEELVELLINNAEEFNSKTKGKSVDLSETDFSDLTLEGVVFDSADLNSSSFSDSQLTDTKFINCDLTSVDFTRANLVECAFNESILNGADFSFSTVNYCNFSEADLAGAILRDADLTDSDFSMSENLNASRFDDTTVWPDSDNLPEDFDSSYTNDLSSLTDEEEGGNSQYDY